MASTAIRLVHSVRVPGAASVSLVVCGDRVWAHGPGATSYAVVGADAICRTTRLSGRGYMSMLVPFADGAVAFRNTVLPPGQGPDPGDHVVLRTADGALSTIAFPPNESVRDLARLGDATLIALSDELTFYALRDGKLAAFHTTKQSPVGGMYAAPDGGIWYYRGGDSMIVGHIAPDLSIRELALPEYGFDISNPTWRYPDYKVMSDGRFAFICELRAAAPNWSVDYIAFTSGGLTRQNERFGRSNEFYAASTARDTYWTWSAEGSLGVSRGPGDMPEASLQIDRPNVMLAQQLAGCGAGVVLANRNRLDFYRLA